MKGLFRFIIKQKLKKNLHIVDGMNHDTTTNPGNEEVLKKIIDWISNLRRNEDESEDEKEMKYKMCFNNALLIIFCIFININVTFSINFWCQNTKV
ncbi:lysophospholipase, putative [Plasmodium chabaudi chabaudi]|uniref:Lysophospholipase, putative n=1 Tax=Plasmodium chabaudi chabaudi TaxID=31271 RepID=A0A1C6WL67_PLACU|nr:lysophospholipase, putative [Plasmodium chabaudi chabaudi]SCL89283.1 lysophospholipase, putative [Plasmodium chabaudi chabaudi]